MATFYLDEQIALQEVELPYLMLHPSLHYRENYIFNTQLQLFFCNSFISNQNYSDSIS
jgi:hypothetical protein